MSEPLIAEPPVRHAVRPRDAASLVLIDRTNAEPRILMGRRHARMKFVPDAFVFPGGKLDAGDSTVVPASRLTPATEALMKRATASQIKAEALAVAAIRETFEETGLLVAAPGHVGDAPGEAWQHFREHGLAPRLDVLEIVARAITPASSPIRFHARFFAADSTVATGRLRGSGELEDLDWYPLSDALRLPVIDVTEFVLHEIARRHAGENRTRVPLYCYRNDKPLLRA